MRENKMYPCNKSSLLLCAFALILASPTALAQPTDPFDDIFGEFSDHGQVNRLLEKEKAKHGKKPVSPLTSEILLSEDTLKRTEAAIKRMEKIVRKGGWPTIRSKGHRLKNGDSEDEVSKVKKQLRIRGDLSSSHMNMLNEYDMSLEDAVYRFQERHGLRKSGYIDRRTRLAMAVSAKQRLAQLRMNRLRLKQALSHVKSKKYVVVNVPDYSLQAVNNGRIEISSRVVVGRQDRQTPTIRARIMGINFNPFWHVPPSLVKADLIPNQLKDPNFMKENKLRVYKSYEEGELNPAKINWRSPAARYYKYRQDPGEHNALGLIRVNMPNKDIVYLHDTPTKKLYGLRARAYSAGCVRVEKIRDLTAWILNDDKKWNRSKIDEVLKSGKRKNANIKKSIPVQFIYVTSWVDAKKRIHFRDDIYDRDQGLKKFAGKIEKKKGARRFSP